MARRFDPSKYVTVQDRINRFWQEHPNGAIRTEWASSPSHFEQVVYRAAVYKLRENPEPDATGYAAEVAGTSANDGANWGNWHENAETSAIGRALANMGYATSANDRMSREEAEKVNRLDETGVIVSWTAFWDRARANGLKTKQEVEQLIGGPLPTVPQAALDLMTATLADVGRH